MSTNDQARALMSRHHQLIKNRQQSMLGRVASEIGMPADSVEYWNHVQGKPHSSFAKSYDRSHSAMS